MKKIKSEGAVKSNTPYRMKFIKKVASIVSAVVLSAALFIGAAFTLTGCNNDEKDPIEGEYSLEVSSPGLDRPLTKPEHFKRFAGYEVKIETDEVVEGRKRFKGKVASVDNHNVIDFVMDDGKEYKIPFEVINKAKLVLTDELLGENMAEVFDEE